MQISQLHSSFQKLQNIYGDKGLDPIVGGGKTKSPDICFIFMNPTARNVAASKKWRSIKAPWIGTKQIWKLFLKTKLFDNNLYEEITSVKAVDWDYSLANQVYKDLKKRNLYITNLAKCTQLDARPLPNKVFKEYLPLMRDELTFLKPKVVVTFGNQVSSILLDKPISVSKVRRQPFPLEIQGETFQVFTLYYPVGQGARNINKAIEDLAWIKDIYQI